MIRRPPTSTLFPYTDALPISAKIPGSILQMSNGVIHAMFWKKCRTLIALAVIAGVCGVGIGAGRGDQPASRSEEHTSELQSHVNLVCRLLLEKKKVIKNPISS